MGSELITVMHRASPHRPVGHAPSITVNDAARRSIIARMRINLITPFAEKDAAKALGARWDSALRTWYIVNVADLTPFLRWITDAEAPTAQRVPPSPVVRPTNRSGNAKAVTSAGTVTVSTIVMVRCGCAVLPWDLCDHN